MMRRRGDPNTILLVNPGADLYGSDRMALETATALVAAGRRVVVTVPTTGPLVPLLQEAGAEVVPLATPVMRKGLLNARGLFALAAVSLRSLGPSLRLLRRIDPGVVLVNTITPPLWLVLGRLDRRLTACHVHESEATLAPLLRRALYLPLGFAHRVIANSGYTASAIAASAPAAAARVSVIHNAVSGPRTVVAPRGTLEDGIALLYVGRLSQRKGPHVAIGALRSLVDSGYDARLRLVGAVFPGNESYLEELQTTAAEAGLRDRIVFAGFQPEVWDELARCDIALVPSLVDESFGNTAVEAALAARPAVVSLIGGLPEAAAQSSSAELVPPGDAAALAGMIEHIIGNWSDYAERARTDAEHVAQRFSRTRYAEAIVRVISDAS